MTLSLTDTFFVPAGCWKSKRQHIRLPWESNVVVVGLNYLQPLRWVVGSVLFDHKTRVARR
jgi:hypothetical protein